MDELSYASSSELIGLEELDDFHLQHGSPFTPCVGKTQHIGMYRKREAF